MGGGEAPERLAHSLDEGWLVLTRWLSSPKPFGTALFVMAWSWGLYGWL